MKEYSMKKAISIALYILLTATLGACASVQPSMTANAADTATSPSNAVSEPMPSQVAVEATASAETIEVDKGLLMVEVTLPASLFATGDDDEGAVDNAIEEAKKQGVSEAKKNEDGSVTYRMTRIVHEKMLQSIKDGLSSSIEEIKKNGNTPSIKDIKLSDDLTNVQIIVDKEAFENSMDGIVVLSLFLGIGYYRAFDGVKDFKIVFDYVDAATGEVFDTTVYPDAFQEAQESN
jgi:hypothetical protein